MKFRMCAGLRENPAYYAIIGFATKTEVLIFVEVTKVQKGTKPNICLCRCYKVDEVYFWMCRYERYTRRQIIIIDSAFPIKSGTNIYMLLKQVEKVDSEQGFRFHDFSFFFCRG